MPSISCFFYILEIDALINLILCTFLMNIIIFFENITFYLLFQIGILS